MRIDFGFLAAGVTYDEASGYPSAQQIGIDVVRVDVLPKTVPVSIVARVRWDDSDAGPHNIGFAIVRPDGTVHPFGADVLIADRTKSVVVRDVGMGVDAYGMHGITFSIDGSEVVTLPLDVQAI